MQKENNVIKALVKLAMCPRNPVDCPYRSICSHSKFGDECVPELLGEYSPILSELNVYQEAAQVTSHTNVASKPAPNLAVRVTTILRDLGIPANLVGFRYIREAIIIAVKNPRVIDAITKELYPDVAKHFGTTSSRVERGMRHAITVACDRGDVELLHKYFGYTVAKHHDKPTNSEFVAIIADSIRLDMDNTSE